MRRGKEEATLDSKQTIATGQTCDLKMCGCGLQAVSGDDVLEVMDEGRKGEWLLELAANNDVRGLKTAVEDEGADVNGWGRWYCRQAGSNKMGVVERSPIMIAALFGSLEVLQYILTVCGQSHDSDQYINKACSQDKSTVLHCAMASGASNTWQMVHLLLSHGANPSHLDSQGLTYLDLQIAPLGKAVRLDSVTPPLRLESESESDGVDWKDILPDSVSVTSFTADEEESTNRGFGDAFTNMANIDDPRSSENGSKYKSLQDHSCADIFKSSIYATDEFRMYSFKVRPCSRAYSHDWTECPFVHPGENARRRDPRKFHYSCVPCPDFRKGTCRHGDACDYAHGVFESWLHPAQYRTRLCKDGMACTRKVCFFAHTKEEVRPLFLSTECGGTSPAVLSPRDMAMANSPGGSTSPSATSRLVSFPPAISKSAHSSLASSSEKTLCDTCTPLGLPTLHLPEGASAGRMLGASLNAREMNVNTQPDVDGQFIRELASFSAQAQFNAAVAVSSCKRSMPSNNGKHQNASLNLMSTNVEDLPLAGGSPRSPLQPFSPRLASKFHDTSLGRVASTASEDLVAAGPAGSACPRHNYCIDLHKLSQFRQKRELGCPTTSQDETWLQGHAHHNSSGLDQAGVCTNHSRISAAATRHLLGDWDWEWEWEWGCPTGKPDWGLNVRPRPPSYATRFRSSLLHTH